MKSAPFDYLAVDDVDRAVLALSETEGARVIAGGQALVPLLAQRAVRTPLLVDIGRIAGFDRISREGTALRLGAAARLRAVERSPLVVGAAPVLAAAAGLVGPVHVRNRATIGGGLAYAHPAGEVPAALLAAGATVHVTGPRGAAAYSVDAFVRGAHRTVLGPADVVVGVELPVTGRPVGGAFREFAVRDGDLPIVGVACHVEAARDGGLATAGLVACGVADRPVRLTAATALLAEAVGLDAPLLSAVAAAVAAELDPPSDAAASGDYRRELAQQLAVEAVAAAWAAVAGAP